MKIENKEDLIALTSDNYVKLLSLIDTLTIDEINGSLIFDDKDQSIRDIIGHLVQWQTLFLDWYHENIKGNLKSFIPNDFDSNISEIMFKKHQRKSLDEEIKDFEKYHYEIIDLIKSLNNEDLFVKGKYSWTGNSSLGTYVTQATASHYEWAFETIKRHVETKR